MDYVVFTRVYAMGEACVTVHCRTSDYSDAVRVARMCGGIVMFADQFDAAYEEVSA